MGLEEKLNQAKGAIKQGAGKLTSDKKVETEGTIEKTVAKAKDSIKDIKDGVEGAAEGIKSTFSNKE
ncbi:CsbD family protein [Streptococcus mutans]|nr:CsbD family protein [Streptococcus mutans]